MSSVSTLVTCDSSIINHLSALHSFFKNVSPSLSSTALVFLASLLAAIICMEYRFKLPIKLDRVLRVF